LDYCWAIRHCNGSRNTRSIAKHPFRHELITTLLLGMRRVFYLSTGQPLRSVFVRSRIRTWSEHSYVVYGIWELVWEKLFSNMPASIYQILNTIPLWAA
jgi:hypothetical protein